MSPEAIDALTDIARRSDDLFQPQLNELKTDDGYQVIDPRTVASTFQDFARAAAVRPRTDGQGAIRHCGPIWRCSGRERRPVSLFNTPVEPVIEPAKQDKRFKNETWRENAIL